MAEDLKIRSYWQWLPFGHACELQTSSRHSRSINQIADDLINKTLPSEVFFSKELTDSKGRDPGVLLDEKSKFAVNREEIFFMAGSILISEKNSNDEEWGEFSAGIYTSFKEFSGSHHIIHSLSREFTGKYPEDTSLREISLLGSVKILSVRVGLQYFESRFASILGYSPVVTRTLLVDVSQEMVYLKAKTEGAKTKEIARSNLDGLLATVGTVVT